MTAAPTPATMGDHALWVHTITSTLYHDQVSWEKRVHGWIRVVFRNNACLWSPPHAHFHTLPPLHTHTHPGWCYLKLLHMQVWYFNSGPLSSNTNSGLPYTFHPICTTFSHTDSPPLSVHTSKLELSTNLETDSVPGGRRGPLSHSQTSNVAWEWDHLAYWPHRLVVTSLK